MLMLTEQFVNFGSSEALLVAQYNGVPTNISIPLNKRE